MEGCYLDRKRKGFCERFCNIKVYVAARLLHPLCISECVRSQCVHSNIFSVRDIGKYILPLSTLGVERKKPFLHIFLHMGVTPLLTNFVSNRKC